MKVETKNPQGRARRIARHIFRHENAALGIILVCLIAGVAFMTKGLSITRGNVNNVLLHSATRGIAAIGQAFVILTGGIDLSIGGIALMSVVLGGGLMTQQTGSYMSGYALPIYLGIPIMLLVATATGALNGFSVTRIGMSPLIVTLAVWQITEGIAYRVTEGYTILYLPDNLSFIGQGSVAGLPNPVIVFIISAVIAYLVLNYTSFGRSVYAAGGSPAAAWLSGLNVNGIISWTYVIAGFMGGLSAVITISRIMSASMASISGLELDSIAAVCIGGVSLSGGRGNLIGVVLGVMILGVINNAMTAIGLSPAFQNLVKGGVIFAAVAVDTMRRKR